MGINILDENDNLRDMGDVVTEVGEKWQTWSRAQQQAAAIAMAGRSQYNKLIALFVNWDMYNKSLEISNQSLGTLNEQNAIFLDSTDAKLKQLATTGERISSAFWD